MSFFGVLAILVSGFILAIFMSMVPVGFSDSEMAIVGRKVFRGLPWPTVITSSDAIMAGVYQLFSRLPVNTLFWTIALAFVSCIPERRVSWRRIILVTVVQGVLCGLFAVMFAW